MGSIGSDASTIERKLQEKYPAIPVFISSSTGYEEKRKIYQLENASIPKAIACPRNAEEVAELVRYARNSNLAVTVRSGGHDPYGRSIAQDALCIDVRAIDFVNIASDKKTASIGGGVFLGPLIDELSKAGLCTVFPGASSIGYVGWATLGGYGAMSTERGLGIDQIVAAEVVDSKGQIVTADEEMLKGIRGGGGNFGVIVSMKIKVYEMGNILAGPIIFDCSQKGIAATFAGFMTSFQSLSDSGQVPQALGIQTVVINTPQMGRAFMINFVWTSPDHDAGRQCLDKLASFGPVLMNAVTEVSVPDWVKQVDTFCPYGVWGGSRGLSFKTLSPNVLQIIGRYIEKMPTDPTTIFATHLLAAQSPSCKDESLRDGSSFNPQLRQGHILLEIVGSVLDKSKLGQSQEWIRELYQELKDSGEALDGSYISLSKPGDVTEEVLYGSEWKGLMDLKKKLDPEGVFKYAIPKISP